MATNGTDLVRVNTGDVVRQEFGGEQQIARTAETATAAVAAREQASVNARYLMALQRPRDVERFRSALLRECKRPGFATLAEYCRPVGKEKNKQTGNWEEKFATGPSIHLMRTAVALYGNMLVDSATMFESEDTRLVHAYALDLENNVSWAKTIAISKTTEKRGQEDRKTKKMGPPPGREVLSERFNTYGDPVYIVLATEDEIRVKESRLLAITQRENARAVLPRDIIDEAIATARSTIKDADAKDPDEARRKVIDAFGEMGVQPVDLEKYVGHPLDRMSPAELNELRGVFVSMREGDLTWDAAMAAKAATDDNGEPGSAAKAAEVAKNRIAELSKKKTTDPAPAPTATPSQTAETQPASTTTTDFGAQLATYHETLGSESFLQILGNNGCEKISDVTATNWKVIAQECEQALKDKRGTDAPQEPEAKLTFGKKPGGSK